MKEINETLLEMKILARNNQIDALKQKAAWFSKLLNEVASDNFTHGTDGILRKTERFEIQRGTGHIIWKREKIEE